MLGGGSEDVSQPGAMRGSPHTRDHHNSTCSGDKHVKKYEAILRRCLAVQKENEMLVNRVYLVKKMVKRLRQERKFLMEELERRGDSFRSLPLTIAVEEDERSFTLPQTSSLPALGRPRSTSSSPNTRKQVKRERVEGDTCTTTTTTATVVTFTSSSSPSTASTSALKRSSHAFLQFCEEQRASAAAQHLQQTGRLPDKKQLTRQLAARWNALPDQDKKMYVQLFDQDT